VKMIDVKKYQELKTQQSQVQRAADRLRGELDSLKSRLKDEFDCDTPKEGVALLQKLESESEELEQEYTGMLEEFEEEWGEDMK